MSSRVMEWMAAQPAAVAGQGGHRQTFALACGLAWRGLAPQEALEYLEVYNQRCQPPWSARELQHKVADAFRVTVPRPAWTPEPTRAAPRWPDWRRGTEAECRQLAALRHLPEMAIQTAQLMGFLRFGRWKDRAAWFLCSRDGLRAQARRMDGQPWAELGGKKAWTLPGSQGGLIGLLPRSSGAARFLLVEGGPDFLAACSLWEESEATDRIWIPLALLGATHRLPPEALEALRGRHVRIFAHADEEGERAAGNWAGQLKGAGIQVDALWARDFELARADGSPVLDLNDVFAAKPADRARVLAWVTKEPSGA